MAELPYAVLPYLTMLNRATPTSPYQFDAAGLKANFLALADGSAIQDEAITIRTISPELMVLLNLSIMATVQTWELLPAAEDIEAGKCYIVTDSIEDHPGGIYQSDGVETWTMLYNWVNTLLELTDCPSSYVDEETKLLGVKSSADGMEFVNLEAGANVALTKTAGNIKIDAKSPYVIEFPAGSFKDPDNILATITGANIDQEAYVFPATHDKSILVGFYATENIVAGSVLELKYIGAPATSEASANVKFQAEFFACADNESSDPTVTGTMTSGNLSVSATAHVKRTHSVTSTPTTQDIVAGDWVVMKLKRITLTGTELVGAFNLYDVILSMPRI